MSGLSKKAESSASSPKCRRKPGAHRFKEQAIFSSLEEATDLTSSKCSGVLRGESVVVTAKPHIAALVRLGSYGKGVFSRSVPCHDVVPSFSLPPRKREKSKVSEAGTSGSTGLAKNEQELVKKMSNFIECRQRRVDLHAQWKMEEEHSAHPSAATQIITEQETPSSRASTDDIQIPTATVASVSQCSTDESLSALVTASSSGVVQQTGEKEAASVISFEDHQKRFREKLEQLKQADQYKMDEYLQLCSEEAFYLSHELNVLTITNESKELFTGELWVYFCKNKRFLPRYAAYCYYRKKGWVPKSGLKFGVDFVLYKQGPVEYHSNYAVLVRLICPPADAKTPSQEGGSEQTSTEALTWRDVVAFDRVSKSVVKDLIICNVVMAERCVHTPECPSCLEKLKIAEVLVKRWDPDKSR